jgi:hypothetical protein
VHDVANGTGTLPSTLTFPCHYHSVSAAYSSWLSRCFYQEKEAKPGILRMLFRKSGIIEYKITLTFLIFKGGDTLVTLSRVLTAYRDSVDVTRDHETYQKLVTRQRYGLVRCAVGIWLSHQRDDTVTAWAGLDMQRDTSPPSAPLAFFTFMMLLAPVTIWEHHGVTLAGYC